MSSVSYEELILLDNLIYLKWTAKEDEKLIDIVNNLLDNGEFDALMDQVGDCIIKMKTNEWIMLLEKIISKPNLSTLKIKEVEKYNKGMKYACFVDAENNAIVVFRGTATINEWNDNGEGGYEFDTKEQLEALNYISNLKYDNIIVTGHSKGGNKAQYVTILSSKINKCISINGQGFSKEFITKYEKDITENRSKITSISAKYDYVNCLFNSISGRNKYINTEIQINPFDYHKAIILLDVDGNLRPETNESKFSRIINNFSTNIISELPLDLRYLVFNGVIDVVEIILCKKESKDNIFKILGEHLIMFCYEKCYNYNEIFNIGYAIAQILILPLLFWNDLIYIEENNSKELLEVIITKIKIITDVIIKKIKIIDKAQVNLIDNILKEINDLIYKLESEVE